MTKSKLGKKTHQLEPLIVDFGIRKVSTQNFSKIVTIPKIALRNFRGQEAKRLHVRLVQDEKEKFIKLTPIYDSEIEAD